MKIVVLQDDLFGYLQHVVRSYAGNGVDPEEGLALYHLNQAIKGAQVVDDARLAKITTGEAGDTPVAAVEVDNGE
jgi:hypothetical protein